MDGTKLGMARELSNPMIKHHQVPIEVTIYSWLDLPKNDMKLFVISLVVVGSVYGESVAEAVNKAGSSEYLPFAAVVPQSVWKEGEGASDCSKGKCLLDESTNAFLKLDYNETILGLGNFSFNQLYLNGYNGKSGYSGILLNEKYHNKALRDEDGALIDVRGNLVRILKEVQSQVSLSKVVVEMPSTSLGNLRDREGFPSNLTDLLKQCKNVMFYYSDKGFVGFYPSRQFEGLQLEELQQLSGNVLAVVELKRNIQDLADDDFLERNLTLAVKETLTQFGPKFSSDMSICQE